MWQGCVVEMELESVGGSRTVRTEDTRIREGRGKGGGGGVPAGSDIPWVREEGHLR